MAELLTRKGYQLTDNPELAEVIIVNTCGFIGPARDESFQVLGDLAAQKRRGQLLIAAGCLTQRYGVEIAQRVPGIDGILGTRRWMDIVEVVQRTLDLRMPHSKRVGRSLRAATTQQLSREPVYHLPETPTVGRDEAGAPRHAVQGTSAYLKIADGCRRPCAFCAIPLIKGTAVSRPMEAILQETSVLVSQGVREINLIAQDTTDYGHDLGLKDGLAQLLEKMTSPGQHPPISEKWGDRGVPPWIRVMYAYPGYVTERLIEVMASRSQIVHYLDMPLQHAHPDTLRRMGRPANVDWVYLTLEKMRRQIPDLALRTTFIVGYPGETEAEFQVLLDFVKAIRFDRVGTFQFSFEVGTPSEPLGDPVPPEVKEERYNRLMELQQGISLEINQSFVGKILPVLIEGQQSDVRAGSTRPTPRPTGSRSKSHECLLIGRSYRDAPEIDGLVMVEEAPSPHSGQAPETPQSMVGEIVPVRITGAMAYDLIGVKNLA